MVLQVAEQPRKTEMGEVRVDVRLTNGRERIETWRGKAKRRHQPHSLTVNALVDTGAARTVIPASMAEQLNLAIAPRTETAVYADGRREEIPVTEPIYVEIEDRWAFEEAMVLGDEVLIGQTALEKMDLLVDPKRRQVIPNPKHPEGPAFRV